MPLYDLMLLLDPTTPSDRQQTILGDVQKMLESGGTIAGTYDWGERRMTFEIDHRPDAAYHLIQFETPAGGALLERIDHSLKIMDGVLRHRIIKLKDGMPPPPMPRPEGRRGWDEVDAAEAPPAAAAPAEAEAVGAAASSLPPEEGQAAEAPAVPDVAPEAAPTDAPEAAPAEAPVATEATAPEPPAPADAPAEDAAPAGDGEEPSGDTPA